MNELYGMPIIITTRVQQLRKHRKRRINKKWRKRYGVMEYNPIPEGQVVVHDGTMYMSRKDFYLLEQSFRCER